MAPITTNDKTSNANKTRDAKNDSKYITADMAASLSFRKSSKTNTIDKSKTIKATTPFKTTRKTTTANTASKSVQTGKTNKMTKIRHEKKHESPWDEERDAYLEDRLQRYEVYWDEKREAEHREWIKWVMPQISARGRKWMQEPWNTRVKMEVSSYMNTDLHAQWLTERAMDEVDKRG